MLRRTFVAALAAAPALYSGPLIYFTGDEAKVVEALTNQIIPADDAPGAVAAGVVFYIDKQLAGPLSRYAPVYRKTIPMLQAACQQSAGAGFTDLPFEKQMAFLRQIEHDTSSPLASFFAMVIDHTMQGFYGSPEHGGNRDEASWKMLGIVDVMEGHKH